MFTAARAGAVLLAGLMTGCTGVQSAQFGATPAPPATRPEQVRVYSTKLPECGYEELGLVTGPAPELFRGLQGIIDGMRRRAAAMGGDALIQLRPAAESAGSATADGAGSRSGYIATVVRLAGECAAGS